MSAIPQLLPANGFRGGEYVPLWTDTDCRIYRLDRKYLIVEIPGKLPQIRDISVEDNRIFIVDSVMLIGGYIYARCSRMWQTLILRYELPNLQRAPTTIELKGQTFPLYERCIMTTDGTHVYFTNKAGHNKKEDFVISKYRIGHMTLQYEEDIVCGSTANIFTHIVVSASGHIYALRLQGDIYKFAPDGREEYMQKPFFNSPGIHQVIVIQNNVYINPSNTGHFRWIGLE